MVAQIHSQANQTLATTTFIGVHDTIMAELSALRAPQPLLHVILVQLSIKASPLPTLSRPLLSLLLLKLPVMHHQALPKRSPGEVVKARKRCTLL